MGVRIATQQDIPALKEIILSGLSNDSVWQYCYPSAGRSEAASNHVETVLKRIIDDNSKNWHCYVVDAPKTHDPVSLAIIQSLHQHEDDGKGVTEQIQQVLGLSEDPSDGESKTAKRIAALQSGITQTQQTYLARYDQVMFLHAVITHPHHKRQGYAKTLSKQTLHVARQKGAVVAALASPFSGYVFYSGTSFSNCGRTKVETDNDIENLELQIMVCVPPKPLEQRRSSIMDFWGGAKKASPAGSRRESLDQGQGQGERRSSFLDMFSFGGPKTPSAVDDDTRRKSHA
ncbi:gnat family protein [Fusarium subglutinans]|uniref:Gnat family protein n=1 Tax=Gibberella subglutinans TaxID=42677 RepID=A0A8H5Q7T5_GIBSU|nr:gnat family protein [Fusarium subglutinans]KAF5609592.1 gnat family protein [Fusarium subglutinans]